MKVLFVLEDYIIDPLGIAYLSSYLKQYGHEVDLINIDAESVMWKIAIMRPNVLAYSITTGRHVKFRELNIKIRKAFPKLFSIFGGPHCTFYPQFVHEEGVDVICQGEGFIGFRDLLALLLQQQPIENVLNIRTKAQPVGDMAPIINKDIIPFPDRKLIYKYPKNKENPIRSIIASFECGLGCRYCYAPKYRDIYRLGKGFGQVTTRMPKLVCTEADEVVANWRTELFYFQDDIFPIWKKGWVDEFCKHWNGTPFHIQIRAEMIHDALIKKLKSVGLHGVTFAVESGNEQFRKKVLNRNMSNGQIFEAARILHQNHIRFRIENMMGVLDETFADTLQTLKLNIKCKPDLAWSSLWQPYPGTELGDEAIKRGLFNPESDKIGFDFFHDTILTGKESIWISNLQKLFGITVRFPFLISIIPVLCRLPKNRFYEWVYQKLKQKVYESRLYRVKPHLQNSKQMEEK